MKNRLIRTALSIVFIVCADRECALASKVGPDPEVVKREARQIEHMIADHDIEGLVDMLAAGTFPSKVKVAEFLKDTGDRRALPELEKANRQFGGWDLRTPCDDYSGVFAIAIWKISTSGLPEPARIDALLELLESRGPIVPELKIYYTVTVNGETQEYMMATRPNYFAGLCAEEELEHFPDPALTARLRKSENKGIAAYAVWRDVRDLPAEAAIARCVQIAHEEGRIQQEGAICCLERFQHPHSVLALDILAGEGYAEAIRVLHNMPSRPDAHDRLCRHLLNNPYDVVRLFAVSAVSFVRDEALRNRSLQTLIQATCDPNQDIRRRAAGALSNYMFPHTKPDLLPVQHDLLLLCSHPDEEVRSAIMKGLTRLGWDTLDRPDIPQPQIRRDIDSQRYPKPYAQRRACTIETLEAQAHEAIQAGRQDRLGEIYTRLLILDPENAGYRERLKAYPSRLKDASPDTDSQTATPQDDACPVIGPNERPALVFVGGGIPDNRLQVARLTGQHEVKISGILAGRDLMVEQLGNSVFVITSHDGPRKGRLYAVNLEQGRIRHLADSTTVRCLRALPDKNMAMLLEVQPRDSRIVLHELSFDTLDLVQRHALSYEEYPDDYDGFGPGMRISPDLTRLAYVVPHSPDALSRWATYTLKLLDLTTKSVRPLVPGVGVQIGSFSSFGRGVPPLTWLDDKTILFQDMDPPQDKDVFDHDLRMLHRFKTIDIDTRKIAECMSAEIPLSLDGGSLDMDPLTGHAVFRDEWIIDREQKSLRSAILPFVIESFSPARRTEIRRGSTVLQDGQGLCVSKVVAASGAHIAWALRPRRGNSLFVELYAKTDNMPGPVKVAEGDYLPVRPVGWVE